MITRPLALNDLHMRLPTNQGRADTPSPTAIRWPWRGHPLSCLLAHQWLRESVSPHRHSGSARLRYLPENLFYNTSAPGIVIFFNKAKVAARRGKLLLVNASQVFEKGDPKNFIPPAGIERIAGIISQWLEVDKLSRIVELAELQKNDYNISPSRYIHTGEAETYRPIAEIVAELEALEVEARETDVALKSILARIMG